MALDRTLEIAGVDVAVKAFEAAVARYRNVRVETQQPARVFVPLAEALWWAVCADEGFESVEATFDYRSRRNSHRSGQVVRGMRYVRNRAGHQRALVVRATHYRHYEQAADGDWYRTYQEDPDGDWYQSYEYDFYWRSLEELPEPDPRHPDEGGAESYRELLQGKPAESTLKDCGTWLSLSLHRLEAS